MKDPAALMYIDTWLSSTAEMDADCRGWYLNLTLHQYDKGSLPDDIEKLAQLAVVRFSEFERFKQVWEQVLKQKFKLCEDGRLRNEKAKEIIRKREKYTEKRSKSGSVGVIVKLANTLGFTESEKQRLKTELYNDKIDIEQAKDKQMLKQLLKLYRNGDEDVNKDETILDGDEDFLEPTPFDIFWKAYGKNVGYVPSQREWSKIDEREYQKIIEHVPKFVKASGNFLKNPENYLKNRCWLDDLPDYSGTKEKETNTVTGSIRDLGLNPINRR